MEEFELIDAFFADAPVGSAVDVPIGDDGAVVTPSPGHQLVFVSDTLVDGVHFPTQFPAADVGVRAVQVNLSDVAAMGAQPRWMLLSLTLPNADENWLREFAAALLAEADAYGVSLVGGDTTRGSQLVIGIQLIGEIEIGAALRRAAQPNDAIYVSGSLGDAAAGLELWQGGEPLNEAQRRLVARFCRPKARIELGQRLVGVASGAIDVSDGFGADVSKLAGASGYGAVLDLAALPLSAALREETSDRKARHFALDGGDDYELCFTVRPDDQARIPNLAHATDLALTCVGHIVREPGLWTEDGDGRRISMAVRGYRHFAG